MGLLFACGFGLAWGRATTAHPFQVRYVLPCLFALLVLAGLLPAALCDKLPSNLAGRALRLLLPVLLGLALALPSLPVYPFYYRRDDSRRLAVSADA